MFEYGLNIQRFALNDAFVEFPFGKLLYSFLEALLQYLVAAKAVIFQRFPEVLKVRIGITTRLPLPLARENIFRLAVLIQESRKVKFCLKLGVKPTTGVFKIFWTLLSRDSI